MVKNLAETRENLMPILWRYLLSHYFRVLILCTLTFIAILFTMRLEEIARFATLGADFWGLMGFILYQIPYILPIAIPISCLISATLLIQGLSKTHELTAFRSCGFAMRDILAPILIASALLSSINFYIVSELATQSHLSAGLLKSELRAINPLLLAHNKHLMELKGFYFEVLGHSHLGESASDVVLAMPNKSNDRLNLLIAKKMKSAPLNFTGEGLTIISSMGKEDHHNLDQLMVENIKKATISIQDFSQMIQKKVWTVNNDHLRLPLLLVRMEKERQDLQMAKEKEASIGEQKQIERNLFRGISEIMRRFSVAIAAFTFSLMGAAFGVSISRNLSYRGLYFIIGLTTLYLISFFTAKGVDHKVILSSLLYFGPHLLIILCSLWMLRRAAAGIE